MVSTERCLGNVAATGVSGAERHSLRPGASPYYRLQHRRATFDAVVALRVEGVSISAIARVEGIAWNTVARWLEKTAAACRRFSHRRITGFGVEELQADEIRSLSGGKANPTWIFVAMEVWSRLWPSTVVGRRSYRNTLALLRDVANRMDFHGLLLIVTDGFDFYEKVVRRVFGAAALYGQVLKTRRNDRIVKVERRAVHGAVWRFDDVLNESEDSATLNTSFIERLNLTIRQSSAYLARRTLSHARSKEKLEEHLLLRCYYNFARPHRALKFGRETRTPAIQAGLAKRRLTLREVFVCARTSVSILIEYDAMAFAGTTRRPATDTSIPRKLRDCSTLQSIAKAKPFRGRRAWTGFLDPFIVLKLLIDNRVHRLPCQWNSLCRGFRSREARGDDRPRADSRGGRDQRHGRRGFRHRARRLPCLRRGL